ncbi:MAG TPA: LytR C-terminal domain-containing protein [Longimicrobiales bacterium]
MTRERLETVLLVAALVAVLAFIGSFIAGLRGAERSGAAAGVGGGGVEAVEPVAPGPRIRVEVLNGSGRPGLARRATELLRDRGFDVVYFGNAQGAWRDSSVVLDRAGDLAAARAVAEALGIPRVQSEPDSTLYLEASVVLGADWTPAGSTGEGRRGWLARMCGRLRGR